MERKAGTARAALGAGARADHGSSNFSLHWKYAVLLFVLALAYRGAYLVEAAGRPDFNLFYMDQEYNLEWAKALASGQWTPPFDQLKDHAYFRAPLYSHFLAAIFVTFGESTLVARILQLIIGSVSCVLAYAVAARCFGQRAGVVTGLICAFYWVLAYFDMEFLLPVLLVFLILLACLLLYLAVERRSLVLAALGGLALGLFAITRPNILAFFPFAIWWGWWVLRNLDRKKAVAVAAMIGLGCVLPPAAATIRNGVVAHDWVVVASQGGVNFYIGNNPESNGMQAVVPGTRGTWWGGFEDTRTIAEADEGRPLRDSEVSSYWFRRGFDFIRESPGHWLRLIGQKALALIGDPEVPNNDPYEVYRNDSYTLRLPLSFGLLFGPFLVSLFFQFRRARPGCDPLRERDALRRGYALLPLLFVIVYGATFLAFFVTGRYRVPLVPFVAMGAAVTLVRVVGFCTRRAFGRAALIVVICAGLTAILRIDVLGVRENSVWFANYNRAVEMIDLGDLDRGIAGLESVVADGGIQEPELYGTLIRAYAKRNAPGDPGKILQTAEEGLRFNPREADLLWFAMFGHLEQRDWPQAMARGEQYSNVRAHDIRGWYVGFQAALAMGDLSKAKEYLARAAEAAPADRLVLQMKRQLTRPRARNP
jgi:4-amino-4-deoxy-L-arabinose transferase-like glycosyltransferase